MPSVSEYSPHSNAQFPNNNSGNKGTERVKQVKFIGECLFLKYVKGSDPILSLASAKMMHTIYGVIKESINFSIYYHSAFFSTVYNGTFVLDLVTARR